MLVVNERYSVQFNFVVTVNECYILTYLYLYVVDAYSVLHVLFKLCVIEISS